MRAGPGGPAIAGDIASRPTPSTSRFNEGRARRPGDSATDPNETLGAQQLLQ